MNFQEYQKRSKIMANYPAVGGSLVGQLLMGIKNFGKLVGIVKKTFRDEGGNLDKKRSVIQSWASEIIIDVESLLTPPKGVGFQPTTGCYPVLGLVDEAAELAEKVFYKCHSQDVPTEAIDKDIKKEAGDVLWYLTQICTEFEISLEEVAQVNLDKLESRQKRGVIKGSGDNR